jgi:hypothetical protein
MLLTDDEYAKAAEEGKILEAPVAMVKSDFDLKKGVHPPPFGLPEGGKWGTNTYCGQQTSIASATCCLCCGGLAACTICCNKFDKRPVYKLKGKVYDAHGSYIGTGPDHFTDEEYDGPVDNDKRIQAVALASLVGFVGTILYLSFTLGNQPNY